MANPYSNLRFAGNVDWHDVHRDLLGKLNLIGRDQGIVIDVFSGYRSPAKSVAVGGFADDPHTRGIAVDANVGGIPLGDVVPVTTFLRYGLVSGNQPNFFNGKPDPAHVQIGGYTAADVAAPASRKPSAAASPTAADTTTTTAAVLASVQPPPTPPLPTTPAPEASAPVLLTPRQVASTWQQLSATFPSPDTLRFAHLATLTAGG